MIVLSETQHNSVWNTREALYIAEDKFSELQQHDMALTMKVQACELTRILDAYYEQAQLVASTKRYMRDLAHKREARA